MENNPTNTSNLTAIAERCIGMDYLDAVNWLESAFGAKCSDNCIDDAGDEAGTYVMIYTLKLDDGHIDLYYLDTEGIVEHVDITK